MSTNFTENYQLSQWAKSDRVLMDDFNADNAKIDAAIKAVQQKADGLAGSKADASALAALAQTVAAHTSSLSKAGNCRVYTTSYTGNGQSGENKPKGLAFPKAPALVVILGGQYAGILVQGSDMYKAIAVTCYTGRASWYDSGRTVFLYGDLAANQFNENGVTYRVVAVYSTES